MGSAGREISLEKHDSYQYILNVYVRNTTTQLRKFINELKGACSAPWGRVLAVTHTEATTREGREAVTSVIRSINKK